MADGTILWHIEVSHYNEKARWALDYKGVPYEKRVPMPGVHGPVAAWLTRGKQRVLPVIRLDGKNIGDSTAIIAALEARFPEPPLYPADPAGRASALKLEDFFDEHLAPHIRRVVWHSVLGDVDETIAVLMPNASERRKRLLRRTAPVARRFVMFDLKINDETAAESLGKIHAGMDRLEAELDGGEYLIGSSFSVADLTAASLFTPIVAPPERPYLPVAVPESIAALRAELEERPGGQWIHEMYRRHRNLDRVAAAA